MSIFETDTTDTNIWKTWTELTPIDSLLVRGNLYVMSEEEVTLTPAGLTQQMLIAFDDEGQPQYYIEITWKLLECFCTTDDGGVETFSFSLQGLEQTQEFATESREAFDLWYSHLALLCINTHINDCYEIERELGCGSASRVYSARSIEDGELYAIKTVKKLYLYDEDTKTTQLKKEIQITRSLNHPNVLRLHRVFEDTDDVTLVFELCPKGDILGLFDRSKRLALPHALEILQGLFSSLSYLHDKRIVHRDVKAENLLLKDTSSLRSVKLADFGIAHWIDSALLARKCGSIGYIAPEVLRGDRYDEKVDIFSAGVVFYLL
jgi:tRNA A-37 threonylcarbamoyl transferase component Bud32